MRVLLSTYGLCGGAEPILGLAMLEGALGEEARMCAPPHATSEESDGVRRV